MSSLGQDSLLECQICFNFYGSRRRPKLLGCGHTCCSACLGRMCGSQCEVACPWCRALTSFPEGLSVSQLPDDPQTLLFLARRMPVFMRLPGDGCYLLPLSADAEGPLLPGELAPCLVRTSQLKDVTVVTVADNRMLELERGRGGRGGDRREDHVVKQSRWTTVCTVVLVVIILLFLLAIILQNIACVSKPFTIIACR
ncbi:E3 ubiquitin-protein ligase rnf152 [Clupea harengus]|uniref:RING-type E3 ubiquitin transferase n=1 Tax=Clupea harengus TaxID=7950 RepID=A0A6P8F783_CLUHA|nr:E3 ubiquitin-protein ligase rnf152 [Clupea harengus]